MINNMQKGHQVKIKHIVLSIFLILMISLPLTGAEEMRGLIIRGEDWAYESTKTVKERNISNIITGAKDNGYNAIFFQVQEAGECFYPSENDSWSTIFNEKDPGFDPLRFALSEAHRHGLQFHVQLDVLGAYNLVNKPQSPDHLYTTHGKKWVLSDENFQPLKEDIYYYLDPGNPEVITYLKRRIREIVTQYEIDGMLFTQLKYPGRQVLGSPAFKNQYAGVSAFFTGSDEQEFAQDVITSCLEALVTEARLIKPYLVFSAQVEPLPYEMRGYNDLNPAETHYFQKGSEWLREGLIDVLVPRMHMRYRSFKDLYDTYRENSDISQYIIPSLRGDEEDFRVRDVKRSLDHIRQNDGGGALIYTSTDALKERTIYEGMAALPFLAHTHATTKAVEIDLSDFHIPQDIIRVANDDRCRLVDQNNRLSISLSELPRNLSIASMDDKMRFSTREWKVPYRYNAISRKELIRPEIFIELRRAPDFITTDSSFQFLFRAGKGETRINGILVEPYSNTGIFFKEIALEPYGRRTRVRGSVAYGDLHIFYEDAYFANFPDTTAKHPVILESVSPRGTVILPPDDFLRITFSSNMVEDIDTILLYANGMPFPLWHNGSRYVGEIPCRLFEDADSAYIQVAARDKNGTDYSYDLPASLKVRPEHSFPLIENTSDYTPASYSRGTVRLGGPYLNEYPPGVRFATNGKFGDVFRVKLNESEYAYIDEKYVKTCPPGTPRPAYNITSISIIPDSNAERVVIPWPEPVPYAVFPEPESQRIRIRLYGVHSNSTWITHRNALELIDNVSWEQKDAQTYDVHVNLKDMNIWGYDLKQSEKFLALHIKRPPKRNDMLIALEAGHGGNWNWGAIGLSGLKEKDINLDVTEKLRDILKEMGYNVAEIRPGDSSPTLRERWLLTDSLQADIFVSIHANAAGGNYLRVAGTSTYYNNPFWQDFAEITYDKLLELPLDEFGRVGSFNYMMCRMSQRPSILVEQAFMSHAEDENKLADPEFRYEIAAKIAESINAYIDQKMK